MIVKIYDTTLRDGAQQEGISFSLSDKLKIAQRLADFGIDYIEGGYPGSNPKDDAFFQEAQKLKGVSEKLVAFCATHHKKNKPEDDIGLQGVVQSGVKMVTVFGKTWSVHSEQILGVSAEENFQLIYSTISYLKSKGLKVFFDAEHFFDGYFDNQEFALNCLREAVRAGAFNLSLCDTNGGMLPWQVGEAVAQVREEFSDIELGIHTHNDSGLAEANALIAVKRGADLVQGTINGLGERTGNANLCVLIPNLALKMKAKLSPQIDLKALTNLSNFVSEVANKNPAKRAPFVGQKSFTHKAGVHVAAVAKMPESYEHIKPELVGNSRETTVSELSGQSNIILMAKNLGYDLKKNSAFTKKVLANVKEREAKGFVFEGADASFDLFLRRMSKDYVPPFKLIDYLIINKGSRAEVEAEVQIQIKGEIYNEIAYGNGPVNALDKALRKNLIKFFPELESMQLSDFKVRILDSDSATAAITRVLIESKNHQRTWTTVGCGENITKASLQALLDALEYGLH